MSSGFGDISSGSADTRRSRNVRYRRIVLGWAISPLSTLARIAPEALSSGIMSQSADNYSYWRTLAEGRVRLSSLGFGAAPIGNLYTPVAEADAQAAVQEALARGIRYFDTAPYYGFGLSEKRLGRALKGAPRDSFAISTKVGRCIETDAGNRSASASGFAVNGGHAVFNYSRDGVQRSFESSLRRLGVDYMDILLLHDVGRLTHGDRHPQVLRQALDEALPAMAALRDSGAVGAIGIGVNEQAVCLELMPRFDLDCIMLAGRYTLLEQRESINVMAEAERRAVKIIAAGPFNGGLLADARGPGKTYNYLPVDAATLDHALALYAMCALEGVDIGAAALQLPLAHPAVVSVVAGQRSAGEVVSAVQRLRAPIPTSLWSRLRLAKLLEPNTVVPST
jgi:D-threo-aldose 1-dehydrogenase